MAALEGYQRIAQQSGMTLTELSLRWLAHRSTIGSVVLGASSAEQVGELLDIAESPALPSDVLAAVDTIHDANPNPCP